MTTYKQARADHEYLWTTFGPACDMTGGYVDSDDLERLLKRPTKATARDCYIDQIHHWFQGGPEDGSDKWKTDPRAMEIAQRYDVWCPTPMKVP